MTSYLFNGSCLYHLAHFVPVFAVFMQGLLEQLMFRSFPSSLVFWNLSNYGFLASLVLPFFLRFLFSLVLRLISRFFRRSNICLLIKRIIPEVIFILTLVELQFPMLVHFLFTVLREPILWGVFLICTGLWLFFHHFRFIWDILRFSFWTLLNCSLCLIGWHFILVNRLSHIFNLNLSIKQLLWINLLRLWI